MRLAWLIPLLAIACGGDDDATGGTTTSDETSSTDPSSTTAPTTTTSTEESTGATTSADASSSEGGSTDDDTGSTSTVDDSSSSDEGSSSTGELPDGCAGIDVIELLDPYVTPIDAATWLPGGSVMVGATMHNGGSEDFLDYPSIIVESDDPLVTSGAPGNQLFGILAGDSVDIFVQFDADDAITPGSDVTFTIRMATLDTPCPNGDSVEVVGTIE